MPNMACVSCSRPAHAWTPDGRAWCERHSGCHNPPATTLQETVERKTAEIEAAGLCHWDYRERSIFDSPASLTHILVEIEDRRIKQDAKHGGPEHDDTHTPFDWVRFIRLFASRADSEIPPGALWNESCDKSLAGRYEDNLIDVAALAVAAIQSSRRKRNA